MTNLASLINFGYTAADILGVLSKKNKDAATKISRLLSYGYSAHSILSRLMGNKGSKEEQNYLTAEEKARSNVKRNQRNAYLATGAVLGSALGTGALLARGLGSSAATLATDAASQGADAGNEQEGFSQDLQSKVPQVVQNLPTEEESLKAQAASKMKTAPQEYVPENIFSPEIKKPESPDYYKTKTAQNFPHLTRFIEKHRDAGVSPEETYKLIQSSKLLGPLAQRAEKELNAPFSETLKNLYEAKAPQAESNIMITPMGAGEVHKKKDGKAYVEVGDKLHKIPESELKPPEPDVVEAVNDILKIPEIDRSSNVALFLYDPSESKAIFQFHDGSAYKYLDIDPEVVRKIAEKEATPLTEGKNLYGAWSPKDKHGSLGAALWAYVLKDPKYAKSKKGEDANPNYMKLETLYDYWEKLRKKKRRL